MFEVLMVHLVECDKSFEVVLEPVGESVAGPVIAALVVAVDEDAFVHGGTSYGVTHGWVVWLRNLGYKKAPAGDRRSLKVKRR
jgi:hypothetical protein